MVVPEAGPELSVVCKSCGSEVSPYVTECPYCGTRLRKRAPKLERRGDELRRARAAATAAAGARRRAPRPPPASGLAFAAERPYVTIGGDPRPGDPAAGPARGPTSSRLPGRARSPRPVTDAVVALPGRARSSTTTLGYLFVIGLAMALFVPGARAAARTVATALLLVACGALGALAAPAARRRRSATASRSRRAATASRSARWARGSCFAAPRPRRGTRRGARPDPGDGRGLRPAAPAAGRRLRQPVGGARRRRWSGWAPGFVGQPHAPSSVIG